MPDVLRASSKMRAFWVVALVLVGCETPQEAAMRRAAQFGYVERCIATCKESGAKTWAFSYHSGCSCSGPVSQ